VWTVQSTSVDYVWTHLKGTFLTAWFKTRERRLTTIQSHVIVFIRPLFSPKISILPHCLSRDAGAPFTQVFMAGRKKVEIHWDQFVHEVIAILFCANWRDLGQHMAQVTRWPSSHVIVGFAYNSINNSRAYSYSTFFSFYYYSHHHHHHHHQFIIIIIINFFRSFLQPPYPKQFGIWRINDRKLKMKIHCFPNLLVLTHPITQTLWRHVE
jgi:hypothetical protein